MYVFDHLLISLTKILILCPPFHIYFFSTINRFTDKHCFYIINNHRFFDNLIQVFNHWLIEKTILSTLLCLFRIITLSIYKWLKVYNCFRRQYLELIEYNAFISTFFRLLRNFLLWSFIFDWTIIDCWIVCLHWSDQNYWSW